MKTTFCVNSDISCIALIYNTQINRNMKSENFNSCQYFTLNVNTPIILKKLIMFERKKIQQTLKLERKGVIQKHACLKLWPKSFYIQFAIIQVHICIIR